MRSFSVTEWLTDARTDDLSILRKIEGWIDLLQPIRTELGFPVVITHGLRGGTGTSQHFFLGKGATDCRPALGNAYKKQLYRLADSLVQSPITRICYYAPGALFRVGGFHLDFKTSSRQLFVSDPDKVNWSLVEPDAFMNHVGSYNPDNHIGI